MRTALKRSEPVFFRGEDRRIKVGSQKIKPFRLLGGMEGFL